MSSARTISCALSSARMASPATRRRFRTDTAAQPLRGRCDSTSRRNTSSRRTSRPAMFRPLSLSYATLRPLLFPLRSWHHRPEEIRNILSARFQPEAFALRHFYRPAAWPSPRRTPRASTLPRPRRGEAERHRARRRSFLRHRFRLADNAHNRVDNAYGEILPAAPAARPHDGSGNGGRPPAGRTQRRSLAGPVGLRDRPLRLSDRRLPLKPAVCV